MTYASTVLTDTPVQYLHLDETSGTSAANSGSASGSATMGAGIVLNQAAAGTIPGTAVYGTPGASNATITTSTWSESAQTFSFETWYKADTAYNGVAQDRRLAKHGSATVYWQVYVNPGSKTIRMEDSTNGFTTGLNINSTNLFDGNWHHLVVTKNGTTIRYYVDGVVFATTQTLTTSVKTGTSIIGVANTVEDLRCYLDEPAFYDYALSATRVTAHYNAGVAATVTNIHAVAPAATLSLTAPKPATHLFGIPAATASITMPAPAIDINYDQTLFVTEDRYLGSTSGTGTNVNRSSHPMSGSGATNRYIGFLFGNPVVPSGMRFATSTFKLTVNPSTTGTSTLRLTRITSTWGELTGDPTVDTSVFVDYTFNNATAGVTTTQTIDISALASAWQAGANCYGIRVEYVSGTPILEVSTSEASQADKPYAAFTLEDIPDMAITVNPPAAAISATAPAPAIRAQRNVSFAVPAATLSANVIAPALHVETGVSNAVTVATVSLTSPGGRSANPDYRANAEVATAQLSSPNASVQIRINAVSFAGLIEASMAVPAGVNINLTTNILRKVPVATANLRAIGIYQKEQDRYIKILPSTMSSDDVWYQMEDSGTTAVDSMGNKIQSGTYSGGPTFGVEGPQLRKAASFDGVNDYLWMTNTTPGVSGYGAQSGNPTEIFPGMAVTIEFSIKTTQKDGTLWVGGGYNNYNAAALAQHGGQPVQVRLEDGMITLYNRGEYQFHVRKDIADGEWHHVVLSRPLSSPELFVDRVDAGAHPSFGQAFFVNIDGASEYKSYGFDGAKLPPGAELLPYTFMAKATLPILMPGLTQPQNVTDFLSGSVRDVIVRLHYAVGQDVAQKLYYEWSNAYIALPPAATLNLSLKAPFKARGNTKRMLMVYGAQWGSTWDNNVMTPDRPAFTYFSNLAGFVVQNYGDARNTFAGTNYYEPQAHIGVTAFGGRIYYEPKTFMLEDYLVYPVSIVGDMAHPRTNAGVRFNNVGLISAAGMMTEDPRSPSYGRLVDEHTGLPRFINLQNDLLEPIENFDVLTVVNYPWATADDDEERFNRDDSAGWQGARLFQNSGGLTDAEWTKNRDDFRDSILEAAYNGLNLWIPEYHMAHHLGFIQGYDIHHPQWFDVSDETNRNRASGNLAAEKLDMDHFANPTRDFNNGRDWVGVSGDYWSYYSGIAYRRIVATEPGLTDIPSNDYGAYIERWSYDPYLPHGAVFAWNVLRRPNGLQPGDQTLMSMYRWTPGSPQQFWDQNRRAEIISAKPDGIAGKVIAREQQFYSVRGSVTPVINPYADNAVTIAAERGTVVRGRPIAGRAFMEFMDTDTLETHIAVDLNKNLWDGAPTPVPITSWDYDDRRYRVVNVVIQRNEKLRWDEKAKQYRITDPSTRYITYQVGEFEFLPYNSMHIRGLNWLGQASSLPAGAVKVFTSAATVKLTAVNPGFTRTRNIVSTVNGAARIDVELRQPENYKDGTVRERAFPVVLEMVVNGIGRHVNVGPIELSLASITPSRAVGGGDKITVYLDGDRDITLFLKEDN